MSDIPVIQLPAVNGARTNRMVAAGEDPRPGTWWRVVPGGDLTGIASDEMRDTARAAAAQADKILSAAWLPGQGIAEHGVILLLKDTRYIDGDLHSLVLAGHPGWRQNDPVILIADHFDLIMVAEPDGQELRKREEDALMRHVGRLTQAMSEPLDPNEVMAVAEQKAAEELRKAAAQSARASLPRQSGEAVSGSPDPRQEFEQMSRLVPAALLPSRDLSQAESVVKHQIRMAEATGELMKAKVDRVTNAMAIVGRYQEEKVTTALASVSKQMNFAGKMLAQVHSMKLWLGEGVELKKLCDGTGADANAPIRFMQQLLYLDEEIFTHQMMNEGFSSDHMRALPELLRDNPDMVKRMLPYERCVAIARVRREARMMDPPGSWGEIFAYIDRMEQDKRVHIFIRDGDNLTMILADEETSGAKRLFPSRREIDALFVSRNYADSGKVIDVTDVRYADSRARHDMVALNYKRFLLILWGAHERERVFGSFPVGLNWLTSETHVGHFDFKHDEEMGIASDRLPVAQWIAQHNSAIRQGSRVVMTWKELLTQERAPGAYSNPKHRLPDLVRESVRSHDIVSLQSKGEALYAPCPTIQLHSSWRESPRVSNVNVLVQSRVNDPNPVGHEGMICIDHMSSAELSDYMESRQERRSYIQWLGQFQSALPAIREREAFERALFNRILASNPDLPGAVISKLTQVAHAAVLAADWAIPPQALDARLLGQARALCEPIPAAEGDMRLSVRQNGIINRYREAPKLLGGDMAENFWIQENCDIRPNGELRVRSEKIITAHAPEAFGDIILHDTPAPVVDRRRARAQTPLTVADRAWISEVLSEAAMPGRLDWVDQVLAPTAETTHAWVDHLFAYQAKHGSTKVLRPDAEVVLGLVVLRPTGDRYSNREHDPELRAIVLQTNLLAHAWLAGHRDEVRRFGEIYADPEKLEAAMLKESARRTARIVLAAPNDAEDFRSSAASGAWTNTMDAVGFRDVVDRSWVVAIERNEVVASFDTADLKTAILRAVISGSTSSYQRMSEDQRADWRQAQMDMRLLLDPGMEERILRLIGMFEVLPQAHENRNDLDGAAHV